MVGGWRRRLGAGQLRVKATLLDELSPAECATLEDQVAAMGRFHGVPAELIVVNE